MKQIVQRQCGFLGHALRKIGSEHQVVTGKVEGKEIEENIDRYFSD